MGPIAAVALNLRRQKWMSNMGDLVGLLEGAAGTALSLLCAARGTRASPWFARCLVA